MLIWIPLVTVVGGGAFAFYLFHSIRSDTESMMSTPATTFDVSQIQREADAQLARLGSLIETFAVAVREGRAADAYAMTATGYRAQVPLERFEAAVRTSAWLTSFQGVDIRRSSFLSGTGRVEGVLRSGTGNVELVAFLTDESGTMRLTGLTLGGMPALPGP